MLASSSCFPAFEARKVEENNYIDGGYYDNMPINLAIKMGATEVIAVDLNEVGLVRKVKDKNVLITYIKPRNKTGSFLFFDKNQARRCIKLGYNDCMKVYNKLDGNKYTFKKNHLNLNYNRLQKKFLDKIKNYTGDEIIINHHIKNALNKPDEKINEIMEYLGFTLKLDDAQIYSSYRFNILLKKRIEGITNLDRSIIENKIKDKEIATLFNSKYIIKYLYEEIELNHDIKILSFLFPKEFLGAIYLSIL